MSGVTLTGNNMDDPGEDEASALLEGEDLAEEDKEGDATEGNSQNHKALHSQHPL